MTSKVSIEELDTFLTEIFDGLPSTRPVTTIVENGRVVVRLNVNREHIRPGGYINGPTQMQMADHAAYFAIFTKIGIVPMAVTSNLNINFLRPCLGEWVEADAQILKLGRTLAVIEVNIRGSSSDKISSQSIVTYSIPLD
jgi:uncharacterized protein (TIGR00369 family)